MTKVAFITGTTGQDGSYVAELKLEKGYEAYSLKRRSSLFNTSWIDHIYQDPHTAKDKLHLHYSDLSDASYVNALGTLDILKAIHIQDLEKKSLFYQVSTPELYGLARKKSRTKTTPFYSSSPNAADKLYAHWTTANYLDAYGMYACNGTQFNHESPRRDKTSATRKITRYLANIAQGPQSCLYMGNLGAKHNWGHAKNYVKMQRLIPQQERTEDFVIATGVQQSVRNFIKLTAAEISVALKFEHVRINETATTIEVDHTQAPNIALSDIILRIDSHYSRTPKVKTLLGMQGKPNKNKASSQAASQQRLCS